MARRPGSPTLAQVGVLALGFTEASCECAHLGLFPPRTSCLPTDRDEWRRLNLSRETRLAAGASPNDRGRHAWAGTNNKPH